MRNRVKCVIVLIMSMFLFKIDTFAQVPENITLHGFGGWAYSKTDNENQYLSGNQDGSYEYLYFSLNITAKPYENLTLHVQPSFSEDLDGDDVELDYAFAEWSFSDALNLRVGKVKAPFMMYTEVYDVGTIRPFFFLPQGVYQELAAEAYKGVGITGSIMPGSEWEVIYDLYGGKLSMQPKPFVNFETLQFDSVAPSVDDMLGGRVALHTPIDGLNIGFSTYTGDIELKVLLIDLSDRYTFLAASAEYIADPWWIRGEYLTQQDSSEVTIDVLYAEAAWQFAGHWQIAARFEIADFDSPQVEAFVPKSYLEHQEVVLGLNYWLNPSLVFKFSYHIIEGNRYAFPGVSEDFVAGMNNGFQETTHMYLLGAQFSF